MKPTPQEEWKKDLVETIVASNLLTEAQGRAFLPFIEKCVGKTILADREKTVAVLREGVERSFFPWKKCTDDCTCKSCDMVWLNDKYRDATLQAFDTASKLLTPAREEKG